MNPLQQLKNEIRQALPDLMELGAGCEITENEIIYKIIYKDGIRLTCVYKDMIFNFYEYQIGTFTILGKPITLPDVLRWMNGLGLHSLVLTDKYLQLLNLWNLEKYTIDEQSEELITFLNNLTTIEKK